MFEEVADKRSMIRVDTFLLTSLQETPTFQRTSPTLCNNSDAEEIATNEALAP